MIEDPNSLIAAIICSVDYYVEITGGTIGLTF